MRKYKNIIKFLTYNATTKYNQNSEQLALALEVIKKLCQRIVGLKLHLVGQRVIPKLIDDLMHKFEREFEIISRNKHTVLKLFSIFKHLPLNYNIKFFNQIHDFLKETKDLPTHLLLNLPYNKLSPNQVSFLQTKMFTAGRNDIAMKLIYSIYDAEYKQMLTPFMIRQAYTNMM